MKINLAANFYERLLLVLELGMYLNILLNLDTYLSFS